MSAYYPEHHKHVHLSWPLEMLELIVLVKGWKGHLPHLRGATSQEQRLYVVGALQQPHLPPASVLECSLGQLALS